MQRKTPEWFPEIEKGVPLPTTKKISRITEAFYEMEIGDSFYLADAHTADDTRINSLRQWGQRQSPPRYFTSRQQIGGGVRVWRVE